MTPTTVRLVASIVICLPTIVGSAANADSHSSLESTTVGPAFGSVSSGENVRPRRGCTPSAVKKLAETCAAVSREGFPSASMFSAPTVYAPTAEKERLRSRNSRNSGGETQNWSKPMVGN